MNELKPINQSLIDYVKGQDVEVLVKNIQGELAEVKEIKEITRQFETIAAMVEKTVVTNETEKAIAMEQAKSVELLAEKIEAIIKPLAHIGDKVHKGITGQRGTWTDELYLYAKSLDNKVIEYAKELAETQKRLTAEAEAKAAAEEERIRKAKQKQADNHREKGREDMALKREQEAEEVHVPVSVMELQQEKVKTDNISGSVKATLKATITDDRKAKLSIFKLLASYNPIDIAELFKIAPGKLKDFINRYEIKNIPGLYIEETFDVKKTKRG